LSGLISRHARLNIEWSYK